MNTVKLEFLPLSLVFFCQIFSEINSQAGACSAKRGAENDNRYPVAPFTQRFINITYQPHGIINLFMN